MEILFEGVVVHGQFDTRVYVFEFDKPFSHCRRYAQMVFIDGNIELLAEAFYKVECGTDGELEGHIQYYVYFPGEVNKKRMPWGILFKVFGEPG